MRGPSGQKSLSGSFSLLFPEEKGLKSTAEKRNALAFGRWGAIVASVWLVRGPSYKPKAPVQDISVFLAQGSGGSAMGDCMLRRAGCTAPPATLVDEQTERNTYIHEKLTLGYASCNRYD
jgi:hypothetical protein